MQRWEIEAALNNARTWTLETFAAMSAEEFARPATLSGADPSLTWSARDHMLHLIGPEAQVIEAIRRQAAGDAHPYPPLFGPDGERLPREQFLGWLNETNDAWIAQHAGYGFDEIVALGEQQRALTLHLLSELSDAQLAEPLREMPWSAFVNTIGELFTLNVRHAHGHHQQVVDGWAARAQPA
jgi:hypothetical protein